MKTTVLLDHHEVPAGHLVRMLLRIEGSAPPAGSRTPLDLALVLDRSGSMAGEKLDAARHAALDIARRLWPEDRVSVVVYDNEVDALAAHARGGDVLDLAHRLAAVYARGSTNLSGGWLRGRELLAAMEEERRIRRILLLTDGLANVGVTDPTRLAGLTARAREAGISTSTIGFGAGYDERLLRVMAESGGGGTYYIEQADQANAIFQDELSDLLDTCAQNVAVTLAPDAGVQSVRVRHGYTSALTPAGVRYDLGDLYAREPRLLLVEFILPLGVPDSFAVATLTVDADVIEGDDVRHETITLPIVLDAENVPHVDATIAREALLLDAADARERALEERERGDYGGAQNTLHDLMATLRDSGLDDAEIQAEIDDLETLSAAPAESLADSSSAKYMHQMAYDRKTGRVRKRDLIDRNRRRPE